MDTGTAQMTKGQKVCAIIFWSTQAYTKTNGTDHVCMKFIQIHTMNSNEDDSLLARSMATIRRAADLVDSELGGWA